jgi:chromosome segregation ATPase
MLAQEASESNATVTVLHQKMKQLKHRYSTDMQREKRISASMQDELAAVRAAREDNMREIRLLTDDCSRLRDELKAEQEKTLALNSKAMICEEQETLAKSSLADAHARMQQAELRAEEVVRTRAEQIRLAEERARLDTERRMGSERTELDSRAQAYRLHYQSELGDLTNQLRHSFAFGDTMKSPHVTSGHHHESGHHHNSGKHQSGNHHHGHHHNENHHGHHHSGHPYSGDHDCDKEKVALKARLKEAASHIERLRNMVVEMRASNVAKSTATLSVSSLDQEKYEREVNRLQGLLTEAREQLILHKTSSSSGGRDGATVSQLQTQLDEHKRMLKEVRDQSNRDHAVDAGIIDDMKSKFDRLMRMHDSTKDNVTKEAQLKAQLDEKDKLIAELTEELKECHADLEDENNSAEMLAEYRRQVASYSERLDEEVSRRQELSRQLQEEKVAHRTTEERMNASLLDMQKRAEQAEFAFSQLKMGKSSRSGSISSSSTGAGVPP